MTETLFCAQNWIEYASHTKLLETLFKEKKKLLEVLTLPPKKEED